MRRGLRPNITFQDAFGARLTQQQRQGGRQIRCRDMANHTRYNLIKLMKTEIDEN